MKIDQDLMKNKSKGRWRVGGEEISKDLRVFSYLMNGKMTVKEIGSEWIECFIYIW